MSAITIEGLHKSFGAVHVIKGVDLEIQDKEFVVFVGPSGCGKSTMLRLIAGLEEATAGSLHLGDTDVTSLTAPERGLAMVFQSYALYPHKTVGENMAFPLKVAGVGAAEVRAKVQEAAEILQLEALLDRKPKELSGGQRQRVAMGRALVRDPKLFLFDEPLSNLDAKLRVEMRTEIKKLHQNLNASMVYVTHDQIEAMTLATKIVVMQGGIIQQIGTPAEIYSHPVNLFVADFMGSPAMNLIPARVEKNDEGSKFIINQSGGNDLILTDRAAKNLPQHVILGIRPEDIGDASLKKRSSNPVASCKIDVVEPAGADTYVLMSLGGVEVTARLQAETSATAGVDMNMSFNMDKASYFDADTGERLN